MWDFYISILIGRLFMRSIRIAYIESLIYNKLVYYYSISKLERRLQYNVISGVTSLIHLSVAHFSLR